MKKNSPSMKTVHFDTRKIDHLIATLGSAYNKFMDENGPLSGLEIILAFDQTLSIIKNHHEEGKANLENVTFKA